MEKLKDFVFDCNVFYLLPTIGIDYMYISISWLFWSKDIRRVFKEATEDEFRR